MAVWCTWCGEDIPCRQPGIELAWKQHRWERVDRRPDDGRVLWRCLRCDAGRYTTAAGSALEHWCSADNPEHECGSKPL